MQWMIDTILHLVRSVSFFFINFASILRNQSFVSIVTALKIIIYNNVAYFRLQTSEMYLNLNII